MLQVTFVRGTHKNVTRLAVIMSSFSNSKQTCNNVIRIAAKMSPGSNILVQICHLGSCKFITSVAAFMYLTIPSQKKSYLASSCLDQKKDIMSNMILKVNMFYLFVMIYSDGCNPVIQY